MNFTQINSVNNHDKIKGILLFRLIVIGIVALISLFPLYSFTTQQLGLNENLGAIVSLAIGWIALPILLLKLWQLKPNLETLPVDKDDPTMQEHISIAKSKLDLFLEGLAAGQCEAYIKFPYDFDGVIEHIWGLAHAESDGYIVTSLASGPVSEVGEELMERIKVKIGDIEDWMLTDSKGFSRGGYTILAMAKIYEKEYGKLPKRYAEDLERFTDFSWPPKT